MKHARIVVGWLVALLLLPTVFHPIPAHPIAHAQETGVPLPVAAFGEHPRLLISQQYVDETLKPRAAANASTWANFAAYVDSDSPEENAEWTPSTALRSLALAWLATGNADYANRATRLMVNLANTIENAGAMKGEGYDGEFTTNVAGLAVGYDWLYETLTPEDRAALRDTLWRAAQVLRDPAGDVDSVVWYEGELMAFGNYEPRWLWALTATALALWGENDQAPELLDFCRQLFIDSFIPGLDLQDGGAWAEGPVYGFIAIWPRVQIALAWWTAAGENYFDDTRWWYDRLAYDMFLYHPTTTTTFGEDWGDPIHSYPSIIGDSERYHGAAAYGRAQDLLLRAVFVETEHGDWMDWFLRQPPDSMPGWMASEEFLWRDPDAVGTPPDITTWYAPYLGHVFMRSNWADESGQLDSGATYVSFNAGDRITYHQFFDQGNFTLFHNGEDLVVRSGVYSGDGTSEHDANYYVRTIAANTILVCDLAEDFDGIRPNNERDVWLNDCGQRTMRPAARTAFNMDYLIANWQSYDTGSITRFGEAGGATYLRADITGAYNSTVYTTPENRAKVSTVIREFVYWRPGWVIVADRVITTYPSYTTQVVFHFQNAPAPSGLFFGSLVRESAVYMQNLLPNSQVTMVEGFQVAGEEVNTSWGGPVSNNFENDPYGYFRLEINPAQLNLENWFLTLFTAQDASAPPPAEGILIQSDTMRGTALGSVQVMFDLAPENSQDVTTATFQVAPSVQALLITGLRPGATYQFEGEGRTAQTLTASEAGLILISDILPGAIRLSVQ
ncbi:MAG: DUF4962 domain-containing protein [Chloroflexi bacterium]|nr:DUF4962 domain-containing protein [Chloroflexota bacterium]